MPWRGHLGVNLIPGLIPIIKKSKSTLIFTNTRSQCELWYQKLLEKMPELAGDMAMHHGSIDRNIRLWVENAVRNEKLKVVVSHIFLIPNKKYLKVRKISLSP